MKSLAIVGMMFLSMGLFAQQSDETNTRKKEPVCLKNQEVSKQCCAKMKHAPIQRVDARKSSLRTGNVNRGAVNSKKVKVHRKQMSVPLRKKNVEVDKKM